MLRPSSASAVLTAALLCLGGCNSRESAEAQLVGTWYRTSFDSTIEHTFSPDQTYICSGESMGMYTVFSTGRWFLDHKRILLRIKDREEGELVIMNIADVTPTELKVTHANSVERFERIATKTPAQIKAMAGQRAEHTITR